jgi:hypothetical protein
LRVSRPLASVTTVLLLQLVGIACAVFPSRQPNTPARDRGLLTQPTLAALSQLVTLLLFPALSWRNVARIRDLHTIWPVLLWHFPSIAANLLLAYLAAFALGIPKRVRPLFVVASSWTNLASITLVVLQALCDQPQLQREDACFDRVAGFVNASVLPWHLTFWTLGEWLLYRPLHQRAQEAEKQGRAKRPSTSTLPAAAVSWWQVFNPITVAILLGMLVALVPELQDLFFYRDDDDDAAAATSAGANITATGGDTLRKRPPLLFFTSAVSTLADATVGVIALLTAATLGKRLLQLDWSWLPAWARKRSAGLSEANTLAHPTAEQSVASPRGVVLDVDSVLGRGGADQPLVSASREAPVGQSAELAEKKEDDAAAAELSSARFIGSLVLVRVLFLGGMQFALVYAVSPSVFPRRQEDSPLIQLMLFMQCVTPSASLLVVACQQAGQKAMAEAVAVAMLLQQLLVTVVTIPSTMLALDIIYNSDT